MDTGEEFYINDFSIFKTAQNNKKNKTRSVP